MPKFIIDQALLLRTIVEVEADSYEDFLEKYNGNHYDDDISHAQMEWNVEDTDEQLFDGGHEEYEKTILDLTGTSIIRDLHLDRCQEEYKREFLKSKLRK